MTKQKQIFRCPICGNIVEVLIPAGGTLVCCGKPMILQDENTTDAALEKHVPIIETVERGYLVKVGSVEHPMLTEHYIQWIELITPDRTLRKYLTPGEKPEAIFLTDAKEVTVREYCNLHGLWKAEH